VHAHQSGDESVFAAHVAEVVITAPAIDDRLRTAVDRVLNWWNTKNAKRHRIVLSETLDQGDVFIAIVDPSQRTVDVMEDVLAVKRAGKFAAVWLVAEPPSDLTQRLNEVGIVPRFVGHGDPHIDSRLQSAIAADLTDTRLSTLTARQVTIHRTRVTVLGPHSWAVTVMNNGNSLITGLTVAVDGAHRSKQPIGEVFAKLRTGRWTDEAPGFLTERTDILTAHTALNFPRWLRPSQHASALYDVESEASLRVCIRYVDHTGAAWSRTNDAEPHMVSTPGTRS
jgi:hypothetical protein